MAPSTSSTITFNIGGTVYKVSKSLLEKFPGSLLERCASKTWNEGDDEVFIEGDGTRFRQVLDYMRHSEVTLPRGESTASFLKELEYYGIEYDKDKIMNSNDFNLPSIAKSLNTFKESRDAKKFEYLASIIATDIVKEAGLHLFEGRHLPFKIYYNYKDDLNCMDDIIVFQNLNMLLNDTSIDVIIAMSNTIISKAGLEISNREAYSKKFSLCVEALS